MLIFLETVNFLIALAILDVFYLVGFDKRVPSEELRL